MDDNSTVLWLLPTQEIGSNGTGDDMDTFITNAGKHKTTGTLN